MDRGDADRRPLRRPDEALYRAKELGRDRTHLHEPLAART
jgi:hypothetical protein